MPVLVVAAAMAVWRADPGSVDSLHQTVVPCPPGVQRRREHRLVLCCSVTDLVDIGQGASVVLSSGLRQTQLLHFLKLHPGHGEVRHELLEGPCLLRLLLVVEGDLLAELPRVGAPGARARHGSGAGEGSLCSAGRITSGGPEGSQFTARPRAHERRTHGLTAPAELVLMLTRLTKLTELNLL